jgi:aspartyl/glutamyl-tRNA(Asn/Gln) amidotransferase C subunit
LRQCGLEIEEGYMGDGAETGNYGPYIQSRRRDIYRAFVKSLVEEGKAYPCFCSQDELRKIKAAQKVAGNGIGYYGRYAKCRGLSFDEVAARTARGDPFVIRLKAPSAEGRKIVVEDIFKGRIELPEEEIATYSGQLNAILEYADVLTKLDTENIQPTAHVLPLKNVLRADEVKQSLPRDLALSNAPEEEDGYFKVPKVVEG